MPALSTQEVMVRFGIKSPTTVLQLFKAKNSPAFKAGKSWMVDESDFKQFLLELSKEFKQ